MIVEYIDIREYSTNIEMWISTILSNPSWNGRMVYICVIGGKQTFSSSGAKCTVQMFLDSCQPVTYLQQRVRNNLTSSFQSAVFKGLSWVYKMVSVVIDSANQMQQARLLLCLCCQSDLGKSIIYFIMHVVDSVRFVLSPLPPHVRIIKKRELTCPTSRY